MKDYIALLSYDNFDSLLRYGRVQIDRGRAIMLRSSFRKIKSHPEFFDRLTTGVCDFQATFEYVIIHFQKGTAYPILSIQDVCGIYPLDDRARNSLMSKSDPRIVINQPLWPDKAKELTYRNLADATCRGIENVKHIFDFTDEELERCKTIITPEMIMEVVKSATNGEQVFGMPFGNATAWVYVMLYHRYQMFPDGGVGYMLDAMYAFMTYLKNGNVDEVDLFIENSPMYKDLVRRKGDTLQEIIAYVENNHEGFVQKADKTVDMFHIVAPLYCQMVSCFADDGLDMEKAIDGKPFASLAQEYKLQYGFAFSLAAYMLGAILGYAKTYDAYYNIADLRIFRPEGDFPLFSNKSRNGRGEKEAAQGRELGKANREENVIEEIDEKV